MAGHSRPEYLCRIVRRWRRIRYSNFIIVNCPFSFNGKGDKKTVGFAGIFGTMTYGKMTDKELLNQAKLVWIAIAFSLCAPL